jgi:glycosyltransferase involved in cell wall biosynthesis/GT2 family glycosyltransferase
MPPDVADTPNRSRWMRAGRECMAAGDWAGAIRAYGQGLMEQPLLGMHYAANLERARTNHRQERQTINQQGSEHTTVVVAAAELSHNAAGRAYTLAQLYRHLGHPVSLLGSHFPQWGRELWEPIRGAVRQQGVAVHSFVVEHEPGFVNQAWELVLQQPADLVHLSKPRLPAVVFGLLYKLLWGAAVLVDIDDEELLFVGEREPITLDGLKRLCHGLPEPRELMGPLWTRLAVDLAQRFDGITVANRPLQQRYGGTVIPHARDPEQLKPATAAQKAAARKRFGVPATAKVILFFGTPKRHKGILEVSRAVAQLPEGLQPLQVVAGAFATEDAALEQELRALLPNSRLQLLGNQPVEQAPQVLALADLVVLLSEGEVAAFQSPAKLSDALAMGLPVLVSDAAPLRAVIYQGWVIQADRQNLPAQLLELLSNPAALLQQARAARQGFNEALALPAVAKPLLEIGHLAMADPKPANGRIIQTLESLKPTLASPLMACRYQQWSERRIDWQGLQRVDRDPQLVSVVVLAYGDPAELDACLSALRQASTQWQWEAIVVMNDAAADTQAVLTTHQQADGRIKACWPGENVQFGLGCNLGAAASRGAWLVFLNNDCRVSDGWLEALIQPLQTDSSVAAVQPRLLKPDGSVQCLGVVFNAKQSIGYSLYQGLPAHMACTQKSRRFSAVTGACMAMAAARFLQARGFTASFINGQEDVDLCLRLIESGDAQQCLATAECTIIHSEGHSPARYQHSQWNRIRFAAAWRHRLEADDQKIFQDDDLVATAWISRMHKGFDQKIHTASPVLKATELSEVAGSDGLNSILSIQLLRMAYPNHPALEGISAKGISARSVGLLKEAQNEFKLFQQDPQLQAVLGNWGGSVQDGCWYRSQPDLSRPFGVNLVGHARNMFGIGEDIRMAALALRSAEVPFCVIDHPASNGTRADDHSLDPWMVETGSEGPYLFNLICMAAPVHARWLLQDGIDQQRGRYTIACWPWETETWPAQWMGILDLADEYWPASELIKAALAPYAEKHRVPIKVQPMAVEIENLDHYIGLHAKIKARERFGLPQNKVIYLCTFDPRSTLARKNPQAAIRAFAMAFQGEEHQVSMVVKALKPSHVTDELRELHSLIESDGRIRFIDDDLDRCELLTLYSACDCLVSLHRSEGYGRNIFEARMLGLEVVATGYGGFTDQAPTELDHYVCYEKILILEKHYRFAAGHQWAEPDVDHAAQLMHKAYSRIAAKCSVDPPICNGSMGPSARISLVSKSSTTASMIGESYRNSLLYSYIAARDGTSGN